jgi:hypothetical protein
LTGNNYLKALLKICIDPYSTAKTKIEKPSIISAIVERIKELVAAEDAAAFVKFEDGRWWQMDDDFARQKIGGLFRDVLHVQYCSSTKSKIAKRRKAQKENRSYHADSICSSDRQQHSQLSSYMASCVEGISSPSDNEVVSEAVVSCAKPLVAISSGPPLLLPKGAKSLHTVPQEGYCAGHPQQSDFLGDCCGTMLPCLETISMPLAGCDLLLDDFNSILKIELETISMPMNHILAACDLLLDPFLSEIEIECLTKQQKYVRNI